MSIKGWSATAFTVATILALALSGCAEGTAPTFNTQSISFLTQTVPPADAGRFYNVVIQFQATGGASLPDRFELSQGELPTGLTLDRDRVDADLDGLPDEGGAFTGNARVLGVPRDEGSFAFTIKAISTGDGPPTPNPGQPDLAVSQPFAVNVGRGVIAILTPTAEEGTSDPAVPAFPAVLSFVNPANPDAFFSFAFLIAGGSNQNLATVYAPREWELSAFDKPVVANSALANQDLDETTVAGAPSNLSKFEPNFLDGGIFPLQAGQKKVQLGGFQSPRKSVRVDGADAGEDITSADPAFMVGLLPDWFQDAGVPKNSRRNLADTLNLSAGDNTLGTEQPVRFTDYFNPGFKSTTPPFAAKYPFTSDEYLNAFFVQYIAGTDLTPLSFRLIVEAIDTNGTPTNKADDVIARKAYIVRVQIPDVKIDTVLLPAGQAGVTYSAQITLSGGVPPLYAYLEWVDRVNDVKPTAGDPVFRKDLFGIDVDPRTWQFVGIPRGAAPDTVPGTPTPDGPSVELTVVAYAAVMNPVQGGPAQVPTGNAGEFDGTSTVTGNPGRHHTYLVNFALPTAPTISNASLRAGIDGTAYPGDRIVGTGGVPSLAPYPPGFFNPTDVAPFNKAPTAVQIASNPTYPTATAQRAYRWSSTYQQDDSFAAPTIAPNLPNSLTMVTSELLSTNGNITGTTFDRGFLAIFFQGLDFYIGNMGVVAPHPTTFQTVFTKTLTLSVSPDKAIYLRGVQAGELAGQSTTGLADSSAQMSQLLMTPLVMAVGLFSVETGKTPLFQSALPGMMDILPVLLTNGGSDTNNRKSIPSISGYWPAESNKEPYWSYQFGNEAWTHSQQELTWLQPPTAPHARVFMWADSTVVNTYTNGTWSQKYQTLDGSKKRGVLIVTPRGDFWAPAIIDGNTTTNGTLFGAEATVPGFSNSSTGGYYYIGMHPFYTRFYYYSYGDSQLERRVHMHGTSSYIEPYSTSANTSVGSGWYMGSLGRSATSVAMSSDGVWCATALQGGSAGKILIWRTDKQPVTFTGATPAYVSMLTGKQLGPAGTMIDFPNSAAIVTVGGSATTNASGLNNVTVSGLARAILPDSLMFVKDGLLFLSDQQLNHVFGFSLADGHLSTKQISSTFVVGVNSQGTFTSSVAVSPTTGQFIPDTDYMRARVAITSISTQFSFAGSKAPVGEEGPTNVAFVAGNNLFVTPLTDLPAAATAPAPAYPRAGYMASSSANKSLFFFVLSTTPLGGLDLSTSTLRDLTGTSTGIVGDLLSPGRFGEELDFLSVSDDGRFAAVVRDRAVGDEDIYGTGGFAFRPSFHTGLYYVGSNSSYAGWGPTSHDIMLVSTDGSDMHSGTGVQHILFMGTQAPTPSYISTSDPTSFMPGYAVGKAHIAAYGRRVFGVTFAPTNKDLIFLYSGKNTNYPSPTYGNSQGSSTAWGPLNPGQTGSFAGGTEISVRLNFRTAADLTQDFTVGTNVKNNLAGLTGTAALGATSVPFGDDSSAQNFWATFKSENGNFLYYISDQIDASTAFTTGNRNYMVGFNISAAAIGLGTAFSPVRQPFTPFSTHATTIGFEQFDCNAWNYEHRFKSVPGGVVFNGRDAAGILCVIGSDSSAGAGSATDLEVYVMDTNLGTNLAVLTSAVTTGTANAINHLSMSGDGNVICGQICKITTSSNSSRGTLNSNTDLFAVMNIHNVLASGATPIAFVLSAGQSHSASVAFAGDGTGAGAQALIYASGSASTANTTWSTRTLKSIPLSSGAIPTVLDGTASFTVPLAGGRTTNDNPGTVD